MSIYDPSVHGRQHCTCDIYATNSRRAVHMSIYSIHYIDYISRYIDTYTLYVYLRPVPSVHGREHCTCDIYATNSRRAVHVSIYSIHYIDYISRYIDTYTLYVYLRRVRPRAAALHLRHLRYKQQATSTYVDI